jgi:hypothetical protein
MTIEVLARRIVNGSWLPKGGLFCTFCRAAFHLSARSRAAHLSAVLSPAARAVRIDNRERACHTLLTVDSVGLAETVRYVGVVVACVATLLAAPGATRHIWGVIRGRTLKAGATVKVQAKRAWLKLRRANPVPITIELQPAEVNFTVLPVKVRISPLPANPDATLLERVALLEKNAEILTRMHDWTRD